jgi:putative ABC transport system substrate-binding protein
MRAVLCPTGWTSTTSIDLPVQQATKFEFVINLKAAKQIGLTIPVRVLELANQVIK